MWPPNNFVSLSMNEHSEPVAGVWIEQRCKIVGRANSYENAEKLIQDLERITDSDDAIRMSRGTRARPAKKIATFQPNSYKLAHPVKRSKLLQPAVKTSVGSLSITSGAEQLPLEIQDVEQAQVEIYNAPTTDVNTTMTFMRSDAMKPSQTEDEPILNEPCELVDGEDGKRYIRLGNGYLAEILANIEEPETSEVLLDSHHTYTPCDKMYATTDPTTERLNAIEKKSMVWKK
ncbi:uncharacterized protein LOC131687802 [Topomyia yanbarensis]|uniref:uncharacterized protein LOC131687802 n=1 Tax=Topomyia yanbarensis TaxID=2498891 RepID=UPI00273C33C3|nr:uncharacterized protein LOC131687802 [Topomyia yanbarensis]